MSSIRFYTDEHIPKAVVAGLRQRGVGAVSCVEVGMAGKTDLEHLEQAREEGQVLITQDNDFLVLHQQGALHAGIAFAPRPLTIGEFIRALLLIHEILTPEEMANHVEFI